MTTIILADDHHVVRQALRTLLEAEPDLFVVGETADGLAVADLVKRMEPDVLVVDLMMPGLNGLDITRDVSQRSSRTQVVILSMHANEAYVVEALKNGAVGYVLKDSQATDLVQAEQAIAAYRQKIKDSGSDIYERLTSREREVLHLVAEGYTNVEIARRLSVSPRTVETHRRNLMQKLNLRTPVELVRYALQRGLLPPD